MNRDSFGFMTVLSLHQSSVEEGAGLTTLCHMSDDVLINREPLKSPTMLLFTSE